MNTNSLSAERKGDQGEVVSRVSLAHSFSRSLTEYLVHVARVEDDGAAVRGVVQDHRHLKVGDEESVAERPEEIGT